MNVDLASRPAGPPAGDAGYAWFRDGNMPRTRADWIAEVIALLALVFSLGIGLVVALLPVVAQAAATAACGSGTLERLGRSADAGLAHAGGRRPTGQVSQMFDSSL